MTHATQKEGKHEGKDGGAHRLFEEAEAALALAGACGAQEVLLGMAGDLRRRPAGHKVSADAAPVPAAQLLQARQKLQVLLLGPGLTCSSTATHVSCARACWPGNSACAMQLPAVHVPTQPS